MIPKDLQEMINKLENERHYMRGAFEHINCAITEKKDGSITQTPVNNPIGMSSDLKDGIEIIEEICKKYSFK